MFFDKAPKNNKPEFNRSGEAHSFELWDKCFSEADAGNFVPVIEKNEKGEILAPNGMVSRLPNEDFVKVTRTPTFKAWFGDWVNDPENASKVVYEDTGEPMVVYHGTSIDLHIELGLNPAMSTIPFPYDGEVLYFAETFDDTKNFGGHVYECFLSIKKLMSSSQFTPWISEPQKDGYSGFEYNLSGIDSIGIFDKEKIMHLPSDITQKNNG